MKQLFNIVISFLALTVTVSCNTQSQRIEIVMPTIQQETTSIWRTINDIRFFEEQGYNINLPKNALIDTLILKSKNGNFSNNDFAAIYQLLENHLFKKEDYSIAISNVKREFNSISQIIHSIDQKKSSWDWNFKSFKTYNVIFTLYGTGGSYDPDEGTITLLTNRNGEFMNYKNPANTIIHEIAHMGMEASLVEKYNLPHATKERLVDTFVYLMFKDKLSEYKIQNMGDTSLDNYLKTEQDFTNLNAIILKFLNN